MLENILYAFSDVFAVGNLMLMTIGVTAGLIAGAIPGFTIAMAIVLTLPFTFGLSPVEGLATMIGVFVGGLSGGLMSGMLTGIPGTPSSIATTFDGFPMARGGKPGLALGLGVWSSFFGGLISAALLVTLAPSLAVIGLEFGPWDYFSLVLFALTITASLSGENLMKGMIAGALGLFIGTVGEDEVNGVARFTFGVDDLESGFSFLPVLIGLFAFSQLLSDIQDRVKARAALMDTRETDAKVRVEHLTAIRMIFARWTNLIRSSFIGVFTGVLPAAGGSISNILAYDQAKKASKTPERFGKGEPDGIIAPEASNNATAGGALITMMALGIPGDIVTAVMLGALLIHNVQPSPTFISDNPDLAYAIFIAFFLAHFIMIAMQSVTLKLFLLVTRIPMYVLASVILAYCAIGVFALNNIVYDIWVLFFFGIAGYVLRLLGFPLAPIILGVVLGHVAELNLSRALSIDSDLMLFVSRPWSLFFLVVAAFSVAFPWYQKLRGSQPWTLAYLPVLLACVSVPMFMMEGIVRPIIGVALLALSAYLLWRSAKNGWKVTPDGDHEVHLEET
ncbi:tripartite tricarboxylate transporter permease [Nisaea acidiphila]|uniref:Tripartite tricarboxylate transporter permease n=1 Tax=Nisaea acidiphila TaxID=1862145 RepID=A0A9J7AVQ3_9PROT|nr:tripartite tricarboxylate transporter permease [Nisaea acidiphila]UUX51206.1 tripartite tricarboxylate transporter permease [Nisaea acidiphila]